MSTSKRQKEKYQTVESASNIRKPKGKKFNEKEFQKRLESFNMWEKRKKEKIEKLKQEKINKEMEKYNKNNIHHNKRMSSEKIPSVLDRLYTKDIKKRRENQIILTQIYTPTFTPFIYTKKENIRRSEKQKRNGRPKQQVKRNHYYKDEENDNDYNNYNTHYNNYNSHYNKTNYYNEEDEDEEDDLRVKNNNKYRMSKSKRNLKKIEKLSDIEDNGIASKSKKTLKVSRFSDNEDEDLERLVVENAFRNRLFKHRK